MTTNFRNEKIKLNEIALRKEKIINAVFTKKEINRINDFMNQDNYIVYYLWNYLDQQVNELAENFKDFKNFANDEIKEIFGKFSEIVKGYYINFEYKDVEKQKECK